jgi:gamma-glutamylcyclotransferase (GGCT)/AIG2-like uncharacterized protein YtfP
MKYFYAAYGMNTNLDEMSRRCPTAVCLGPAQIHNYEFVFRTHADIQHKQGAKCDIVLWKIDNACLKALDALEGYPYYYTRSKIRVHTGDRTVKALVYQMNDQSLIQEPSAGYLQTVTEGYQQNGVPTTQIDHAINMTCSSLITTTAEYPFTRYATTRDFV